jgi:hypothetical protein
MLCRGGGIRTRGRSPYDRFQGGSDRPLRHPSSYDAGAPHTAGLYPTGSAPPARDEISRVTSEPATVHRLAPAIAARLLGVVLVAVAALILVSTLLIAVLDLHTVFLLVPVLLTVVVLTATWWTWRQRGWVVRLTAEGYRVQWVRGVGAATGRWKDVEDAVTTTIADAPVVVLRLRDGRTTTIPVEMLAVDREAFVRDIQEHLQRGHGLRKW